MSGRDDLDAIKQSQSRGELVGEDFSQVEPLTVRLRGLLHQYPEGIGILKELIQNADDAGARHVIVTVDWRDLSSDTNLALPDPRMAELLGPALMVHNDAEFTARDFEHIRTIGDSAKVDDVAKTGRFGIGFNAVYHVTDCPSFVSSDRLIFFDPHGSFVTRLPHMGVSYSFEQKPWERMPQMRQAFEAGGFVQAPETGTFRGTLFRLPLRSERQATSSQIKNVPFGRIELQAVLDQFRKDGEEMLLFLKSVESIAIREIQHDNQKNSSPLISQLLSVETTNVAEVRDSRERLKMVLALGRDDLILRSRSDPGSMPQVQYVHEIVTTLYPLANKASRTRTAKPRSVRSRWRIVSGLRVDTEGNMANVMEKLATAGEKLVPWAGAAARLPVAAHLPPAVTGRVYCFLPLPIQTDLPIHINGFFDLDSSRSALTVSNSGMTGRDALRGTWNELLVTHVLAPLCADLVVALREDLNHLESPQKELTQEEMDWYYRLWPVRETGSPALSAIAKQVANILRTRPVVRVRNSQVWANPEDVKLLPIAAEDLAEPLTELDFLIPQFHLPFDERTRQRLGLNALQPTVVRERLIKLGVSISETAKLCKHRALRRHQWIVSLLRFCLSDGSNSVKDLPLALRMDRSLAIFDGKVYRADADICTIFRNHPQWFLAPKLLEAVPRLEADPPPTGLPLVTPALVAINLKAELQGLSDGDPWLPSGPHSAAWISCVLRFLARHGDVLTDDEWEEVNAFPLIPGSDGCLHCGGDAMTPLLAEMSLTPRIRRALNVFGVHLVDTQGDEALESSFRELLIQQPAKVLWPLTAADAIDTLATRTEDWLTEGLVATDEDYTALLDYLGESPRSLNEARLKKLKLLPIFAVVGKTTRTMLSDDIYLSGVYSPPAAGVVQLLDTGPDERWRPLLRALGVTVLDRVVLIRDFLLPRYQNLSEDEQVSALAFIRDNLERAISDSGGHTNLKDQIAHACLVRCADGKLRAAADVYDPEQKIITTVLGDTAPVPDFVTTYAEHAERWRTFFTTLSWRIVPYANDILTRVDCLIAQANVNGPDTVAGACRDIFAHVIANWEKVALQHVSVSIAGRELFLADALRDRAWLSVQYDPSYLRDFPAAKVPENRLYQPRECTFVQSGNVAASELALFQARQQPSTEQQRALGFLPPGSNQMNEICLRHFEAVISWYEAQQRAGNPTGPSEATLKTITRALGAIYSYLQNHFVPNATLHPTLRTRFAHKPCLWDGHRFWKPTHCFQEKANVFGDRRGRARAQQYDTIYRLLGQKSIPEAVDYIDFLQEIHRQYAGRSLTDDDQNRVVQVLACLSTLETQDVNTHFVWDMPLLSNTNCLILATRILINDAHWYAEQVANESAQSGYYLLHPNVSPHLARQAGALSLFENTEQRLTRTPQASDAQNQSEYKKWQQISASSEFYHAIQRIWAHENVSGNLPMTVRSFLKNLTISPAANLVTDLFVAAGLKPAGQASPVPQSGICLARDVPADYYTNHARQTIFLRRQDNDMMLRELAKALSRDVFDDCLKDTSLLEKLFDRDPKVFETFLDKSRIRRYQDPNEWDSEDLTEELDYHVMLPVEEEIIEHETEEVPSSQVENRDQIREEDNEEHSDAEQYEDRSSDVRAEIVLPPQEETHDTEIGIDESDAHIRTEGAERVSPSPAIVELPGPNVEQSDIADHAPSVSGGHWNLSKSTGVGQSLTGGHGSGRGGGPSQLHDDLQSRIAKNPTLLGNGLSLVGIEYRFQTDDRVDVLLRDESGAPVTVEVEAGFTAGNFTGVLQASKYQHIAAIESGRRCGEVRTMLVANRIPESVRAECIRLGVEPVELSLTDSI